VTTSKPFIPPRNQSTTSLIATAYVAPFPNTIEEKQTSMARISFSGLARYLGGSPVARRSIVQQSKYPSSGPLKSYSPVDQRIVSHLVDGTPLGTSGLHADYLAEAIEAYEDCDWPEDDGRRFGRPNTHQGKLEIQGVEISVYPTALVSKNGRNGACKLHYAKATALDEATGQAMAALLYYYGRVYQNDSTYDPGLCEVIAVRTGECFVSTGNYRRLIRSVEAACEEIKLRWDSL
jgi:hypothetical protein